MSRSVLVSYEFVNVHFLHFGELKMRFCTALHLSIGCTTYILNNFGCLGVNEFPAK